MDLISYLADYSMHSQVYMHPVFLHHLLFMWWEQYMNVDWPAIIGADLSISFQNKQFFYLHL